jgi:hypothetical protein
MPQSKDSFDAEKHVYRSGRLTIPSVTQTLAEVGIAPDLRRVPPDVLAHKRRLGTYMHQALQFLLEGDLDEGSVDMELAPYLDAFRLFQKDHGFKPTTVEDARFPSLDRMPYGMRADVTGTMRGEPWLLDFKSTIGNPCYSWAIQLAAYAHGLPAPLIAPFRYHRASLQLLESGRYKLKEWKDTEGDIDEFRAALYLTWRRINRGEKPWEGR